MKQVAVLFIIPFFATFIIKYLFLKLLTPQNRWGIRPTGMGFIFVLASLTAFVVGFFSGILSVDYILIYIIGMFGMGVVGLINDTFRPCTPFYYRLQLKGLLKGDRQCRIIKGIMILFASVLISMIFSRDLANFLVNILLVILMTNFINIMDSGPGRACKSFLFFYPFILLLSGLQIDTGISLIMLGAVAAFVSSDLRSKLYMGEVGANILGVWLAITAIDIMDIIPRTALAVILLILNILGERFDFSSIIEKNALLRVVDRWGRDRQG